MLNRSYPFLTQTPTRKNGPWECNNAQGWLIFKFKYCDSWVHVSWIRPFFGCAQNVEQLKPRYQKTPLLETSQHLQVYTRFQRTSQPYKIDPFRNTFCQTLPPANPWIIEYCNVCVGTWRWGGKVRNQQTNLRGSLVKSCSFSPSDTSIIVG